MTARRIALTSFLLTLSLAIPAGGAEAPAKVPAAPKEQPRRGSFKPGVFEAFSIPDYQVDQALSQKIREEIAILTRLLKRTTEPNRRADMYFRIAELYWLNNRSRYFQQMEVYNKAYDEWFQGKRKVRPVEPQFSGAASFTLYKQIIQTASTYDRLDEVMFLAGFHATEVGDSQALGYFKELVARFPKSKFRLDSYMEIGDLEFMARRFDEAIAAFNIVLKEPSKLYNFALYKLSWCFYNQGKINPATQVMQKVVRSSKGIRGELELRDEALKDLVIFYSDLGLIDEAQQYFVSIGEPEYAKKVLQKLSNIYFEQARYDKAIATIRRLMAIEPFGAERPKYHSKLVDCYDKSQDLTHAMSEMEEFISMYDKNSIWYRQANDPEMREYAYERSEVYARFIPKKYHELSQQTAKTDPAKSAGYTRAALNYYWKYLDRFGDHKNAYENRYLYADLLFKNKMYAQAVTEFDRVAKADKNGKRRKEALVGEMDALTELEKVYYKNLETKGIKQKDNYEPLFLSVYAQRLIEVDEAYIGSFPQDPRVPDIALQRSQLLYNYNQFSRASDGFFGIVKKYPQSPASHTARDLILDIYNIRKDWENLGKWAETFLADKSYATAETRAKLLELIQGSIFQKAKVTEDKKEYVAAAEMFEKLAIKYPDSKYADKALFNAAIDYINADASEKAMGTSNRFLRKYPDSEMVSKLALALATYFDDKLDYAHAAQYYELLAEKDPKGKYAADALFNAGTYEENLREYPRALASYETHLKRYPNSKDSAEIAFSIALIHEKQRHWTDAIAAFKDFPRRHSSRRARVIEAYYRLGQALGKTKDEAGETRAYQSAVYVHRQYAADPEVKGAGLYAAKAALELTKPMLADFREIRLRMPQAALTRAIEQKALLLKKLRDRYLDIINFGDPEMGVAALHHVGVIYQEFSQALFNAPVPKKLTPEEVQMYQQELTNRAAPIEEKAVEAYEKAIKKAFELEVFNEWALKSYAALTEFKPDLYPPRRGYVDLTMHLSEPFVSLPAGQASSRTPADFRREMDQNLLAIESDPRDFGAYMALGRAYRTLGRLGKAASSFESASLVQSRTNVGFLELARALTETGQAVRAIPIYRDLLSKEPTNLALKNDLAIAYRRKKDYGSALALIREILNVDKTSISAINNLALIYYQTQAYDLAELTLQKGKKINSATADTYNNLGLVYIGMDLMKNAIAEFKKASELAPNAIDPRLNLANLYLKYSNYPAAIAGYQQVLNFDPLHFQAIENLGTAYQATNDVAKSRQAFAAILDADPTHSAALFNMGLLYQNRLQDAESALKYFRQFASVERGKIRPDHEVFMYIKQLQAMPKRPRPAPTPSAPPPPQLPAEEKQPKGGSQ
ncbi:MAG: tetratricopeptide repeat protein [Pseudomonadota bacterium]